MIQILVLGEIFPSPSPTVEQFYMESPSPLPTVEQLYMENPSPSLEVLNDVFNPLAWIPTELFY